MFPFVSNIKFHLYSLTLMIRIARFYGSNIYVQETEPLPIVLMEVIHKRTSK